MKYCTKCGDILNPEEEVFRACMLCVGKFGVPCFRCGNTEWQELKKKIRRKGKLWTVLRCNRCGERIEVT